MSDRPELTLYYDGHCPFCNAEINRLNRWNGAKRLAFVDISAIDFDPACLGVGMPALDREVHSLTAAGELLVGVDTMQAAYTLVGRGWMVLPLRVPMLRSVLAHGYRWFARNRYAISRWLGYKPVSGCSHGTCEPINPFFRGR